MSSKSKRRLSVALTLICLILVGGAVFFTLTNLTGAGGNGEKNASPTDDDEGSSYVSGVNEDGETTLVEADIEKAVNSLLETTEAESKTATETVEDLNRSPVQNVLASFLESVRSESYAAQQSSRAAKQKEVSSAEETTEETEETQETAQSSQAEDAENQGAVQTGNELFENHFATVDAKIATYLNVREKPAGEVIGMLFPNTGGQVLGVSDGWVLISSGNVTGWVSGEYIATGLDIVNAGPSIYVTVAEDCLYFRSQPDAESSPLDILTLGTIVNYISYTDDWIYVEHEGKSGYLYADYVDVSIGDNVAITVDEYQQMIAAAVAVSQAAVETQPIAVPETTAAVETQPAAIETQPVTQPATQPATVAPTEPVTTTATPVVTTAVTTESASSGSSTDIINQIYAQGNSSRAPLYLSDSDIYLIACVTTLESGGRQPHESKLAVANVIRNRIEWGYWGSTATDVIYAPGQFAGSTTGLLDSYLAKGPEADCLQAVYEALAGVNNVADCIFFKHASQTTYSYSYYIIYGSQVFYKK